MKKKDFDRLARRECHDRNIKAGVRQYTVRDLEVRQARKPWDKYVSRDNGENEEQPPTDDVKEANGSLMSQNQSFSTPKGQQVQGQQVRTAAVK